VFGVERSWICYWIFDAERETPNAERIEAILTRHSPFSTQQTGSFSVIQRYGCRFAMVLLCLFNATWVFARQPGDSVKWGTLPKQCGRDHRFRFLCDILCHCPRDLADVFDHPHPVTCGHETTHGINSYLRGLHPGQAAFYIGEGKYAVLAQPRVTLTQIGECIPEELRGTRYDLYFVQQTKHWDNRPLYCFDEWVAYINGAIVGLEVPDPGDGERTDYMLAPAEFAIYALCACVAIDKHDPNYLKTNPQFREFVAHELKRAMAVHRKGIQLPHYRWDTTLVERAGKNKELAAVLRKMYGDQLTLEMLFR
jgi:hypothetical protein